MSEKPKESEQPKAPEATIYQRDKTAKEPTPLAETPKPPANPKPKIKKGHPYSYCDKIVTGK